MKPFPAATPARTTALAAATLSASLLAGCGTLDGIFSSDKVDYKSASTTKARPLEVPPDLTQLARDNRYAPQGGVISASSTAGAGATQMPSAAGVVAPLSRGEVRVERQGNQRWLVVPMTPEQLWPQLKAFWADRGFTIATESAEAGVMETNWAENRAKLPNDVIRSALGRVLGNLYDTGERDLFRTRVERTAAGSEVYISHRGLEEVYVGERKDSTAWRTRPSDPQLEAEFLGRLMARLGPTPEAAARTAVAAAPEGPARARAVGGAAAATLEVDEPFDRAWRRVGLALDRSGFTVEDRDRAAGVYYVRYVDPKNVGKEEPGFFSRLFGGSKDGPTGPQRFRVALKSGGDTKTTVSVLNAGGTAESGEAGQRIVTQLVADLR